MQRKLQNRVWIEEDRESFVQSAAEFWGTTEKDILAKLAAGEEVKYDGDWYAYIRQQPAEQKYITEDMVECACGHSAPTSLVMSTSTGTSCPSCYDRMSGSMIG